MGGGDDRRVLGEPEVVVRRERAPPAARPARASRRAAASRSRGARHWPASRGCRRLGLRPGAQLVAPSSRGRRSSIASCERVHGRVELLRRDGERRHEDHGVADRSEQHAALAPRRRTPAVPSAARRAAARARRRPSARAAGRRATWAAARCGRRAGRAARSDAVRTLASTSHASMQLEVAERDRGRERVPAVGVPVVQRLLRQVRAEERGEDPPDATVADIGR